MRANALTNRNDIMRANRRGAINNRNDKSNKALKCRFKAFLL